MLDTSQIDNSTVIGQATLLILSVAALIGSLTPVFKGKKFGRRRKGNYGSLLTDLEITRKDLEIQRRVNRNSARWQLTARELIHTLKASLSDSGIPLSEKIRQLTAILEKIEDEDPYEELFGEEIAE